MMPVAVISLSLTTAQPSAALSCAGTPETFLTSPDHVVFTGKVISVDESAKTWRVGVDEFWRADRQGPDQALSHRAAHRHMREVTVRAAGIVGDAGVPSERQMLFAANRSEKLGLVVGSCTVFYDPSKYLEFRPADAGPPIEAQSGPAETGDPGTDWKPWLIAGGSALVLLAGSGVLIARRRAAH